MFDVDYIPSEKWGIGILNELKPGHILRGEVAMINVQQQNKLNISDPEWWKLPYNDMCDFAATGWEGINSCPGEPSGNIFLWATYKQYIFDIHGYDEGMIGWGSEDDDLAWRMWLNDLHDIRSKDFATLAHLHSRDELPDCTHNRNLFLNKTMNAKIIKRNKKGWGLPRNSKIIFHWND